MPPKKEDDKAAQAEIADYMLAQNRPYNALDVGSNLHDKYPKPQVQRVLENLCKTGDLIEKLNGKQKIYYANQSKFPKMDKSELAALDKEITTRQKELATLTSVCDELETELKALTAQPKTDAARLQLATLHTQNAARLQRLQTLRSSADQVSEADLKRVDAKYTTSVNEWRKRKRWATDMVDSIMEGYPKKKKVLHEEIGLEDDDAAKVDLKNFEGTK